MANIEQWVWNLFSIPNSRHPSEVAFQISSSKLIESSVKENHFVPTVSPGSPECVGQVDSPLRKLHGAEKKQNVSGILKGADSSQIRQNLFLVHHSASTLPSLREGGPAWTLLHGGWSPTLSSWEAVGNGIFVHLLPFQPLPTPVILEGIMSKRVGELIHPRTSNFSG